MSRDIVAINVIPKDAENPQGFISGRPVFKILILRFEPSLVIMMDNYMDYIMNGCNIEKTSVVRNDHLFYFDTNAKNLNSRFILQLLETPGFSFVGKIYDEQQFKTRIYYFFVCIQLLINYFSTKSIELLDTSIYSKSVLLV